MKKIVPLLTLVLVACGKTDAPPPPPPTVSVANPLVRDVVDWDDYTGRFEAPQDVEVRARATGNITRIFFRDGQDVRRGQPLFEIDPRTYRARFQQARAQLLRAQAALANARTVEARSKKLLESQAVSREEYERDQAALRTAEADLAAGRAEVEAARVSLDFTVARAPFAGRVSDRRVSLGDAVADGTTVLTRVVSLDPIWFAFEGAESFYLKNLRQDQRGERGSSRYTANPVEVQLADESGYRWKGRMIFLDNAVDEQSGTIRAKALIANPTRFLTPGMYGRARLLGSGTYRAMLIPEEAIVTDQTRKVTYVVGRDGKTAQRQVETGPLVDGLRVVKAGLAPTDMLVLTGLGRMQPGMAVTQKKTVIKPRASFQNAPKTQALTTPPSAEATASTGD
ncbi:efflux RND transporter periplasmic adaptor subunit [Sphingomonas naphthae]|uniref:Efflux RND transporter periplasmic adaptor subunit n=1 Tax=Sphingomonas naphthae TaxID=1813468 RepID=A0ABY7TPA7_9SPHN|nr:efflux RND transporter periplasmic adaptor subunit [Sphingomonas naphthae]WCT74760.1 efflux RND transporter periplasmic adaptor subunit [Sphingomonas naphthae]